MSSPNGIGTVVRYNIPLNQATYNAVFSPLASPITPGYLPSRSQMANSPYPHTPLQPHRLAVFDGSFNTSLRSPELSRIIFATNTTPANSSRSLAFLHNAEVSPQKTIKTPNQTNTTGGTSTQERLLGIPLMQSNAKKGLNVWHYKYRTSEIQKGYISDIVGDTVYICWEIGNFGLNGSPSYLRPMDSKFSILELFNPENKVYLVP